MNIISEVRVIVLMPLRILLTEKLTLLTHLTTHSLLVLGPCSSRIVSLVLALCHWSHMFSFTWMGALNEQANIAHHAPFYSFIPIYIMYFGHVVCF